MKPYKTSSAAHWLRKFDLKRQGFLSYVSPGIYDEQHSCDVIEHSTDKEIRALGLDPREVRGLARRSREAREERV